MFLVNSCPPRFYVSLSDSLLANVRKNFAEFLIDNSPITLEYSSGPLVLVLVQSSNKRDIYLKLASIFSQKQSLIWDKYISYSFSLFFPGSTQIKRQRRNLHPSMITFQLNLRDWLDDNNVNHSIENLGL